VFSFLALKARLTQTLNSGSLASFQKKLGLHFLLILVLKLLAEGKRKLESLFFLAPRLFFLYVKLQGGNLLVHHVVLSFLLQIKR